MEAYVTSNSLRGRVRATTAEAQAQGRQGPWQMTTRDITRRDCLTMDREKLVEEMIALPSRFHVIGGV